MTRLVARSVTLDAHRLRYEDLYSEEPDTPDWILDCMESGELTPQRNVKDEGFVVIHPDGRKELLRLGKWLAKMPSGRLVVLDDEIIAEGYEVSG